MTCPSCGRPVPDAAASCPACQASVGVPAAAPVPAAATAAVDAAWREARTAFTRYDYAATSAACAKVLELLPTHEEAGHLKTQAEEKWQALEAALQLANGYFNKGQYELALVHFNTAIGLRPGDESIRRKQEMAKLLVGQDLTAYTPKPVRRLTAQWADEVVPSPVSTLVMAGIILAGVAYLAYYTYDRTQKRHRTAEQLFRQVEQRLATKEYLSGESRESYQRLTTLYGNTSFAKDAAQLFEQAKAKKLEEAPRLLDQAEAYLRDDQPTLALELARDVLQWDPANGRAQDIVSRAEEGVGQLETRYMREALTGSRRPRAGAAPPTTAAAPAAASSGANAASPEAADLLEQEDQDLSPAVEKLAKRGQDRFNAGDYASAAFFWEKALAQHGRPHQILARLAAKARLLDERERRRFEEDVARAKALEEAQQWPEALMAYRAAQTHRPADADVAQKIVVLRAKIQLPPETPPAPPPLPSQRQAQVQRWRNEAIAHEQRGQWRQAAEAYRKALADAPDPSLRERLNLNLFMAMQERRRARKDGAPDLWHDVALTEAYLVQGHPARARQLLLAVLPPASQHHPGRQSLILALIGQSYAVEKTDDEAIASYRQSLQTASVWYVQHSLAQAIWRSGEYLEAMRLWEQLLRYAPNQADVIASLAAGYVLMDAPAKAQALMQPLKAWKMEQVRTTQRYPPTVRPDYWLGLTTPRELLAETCEHVAQTWMLLDQPLEALRWRQLAQAERTAQAFAQHPATPPQRSWWWPWSR